MSARWCAVSQTDNLENYKKMVEMQNLRVEKGIFTHSLTQDW
jgi:hypothetical protein